MRESFLCTLIRSYVGSARGPCVVRPGCIYLVALLLVELVEYIIIGTFNKFVCGERYNLNLNL